MILIADGGSTKTSWTLISNGALTEQFHTEGYNPYYASTEYIIQSLTQSLPAGLILDEVLEINFYGAGIHNAEKANIVKSALKQVFCNCEVHIKHDLLAAARALLGGQPGFAAILGTGTNTCLYDGRDIIQQIDSCGYIIGDEGSGCHMGLKLLKDYLRKTMPSELIRKFDLMYAIDESTIMDQIYTQPFASRYAAGFTRFLTENINHEYCKNLITSSFRQFFEQLVAMYPSYQDYTFNCIGSIGYIFRESLTNVAAEFNMKAGAIVSSPMNGLVNYHLKSFSFKP